MYQLVVHQPNRPPQPVRLEEDCLTIGRAVDNLLILDDPSVETHHALVLRAGQGHRLCALNPAHPLTVNGLPVHDHTMRPGDIIRVGLVELRYQAAGSVADSTSEAEHRLFDRRGPWIGVTILASLVSAAVTFVLTSRLPDRALEVASPLPVDARPTSTTPSTRVFPADEPIKDRQGRFTCEGLTGWSWSQREDGAMTEVVFMRGDNEVRLQVRPAGQRPLDPAMLADKLAGYGVVQRARWRPWAGAPAVEVELHRVEVPAQWVRVLKMRHGSWDHIAALYVGDPETMTETVHAFERWLASYRVGG